MIVRQRNHRMWHKLNAGTRYLLYQVLPYFGGNLLVNEFPKSGGTWLTTMLADALQVPFARNRLPYLSRSQIFHGHIWQKKLIGSMPRVLLWRDGRDVMVSLYYHCFFYNELGNYTVVEQCRKEAPFNDFRDVEGNLPEFIELISKGRLWPYRSWADFVGVWAADTESIHTYYEGLYDACPDALANLLAKLGASQPEPTVFKICDRYNISRYRRPREHSEPPEGSSYAPFIRRGGYGNWRGYFNNDAIKVFATYQGKALIKLGYELDDSWAEPKRQ